MVKANVEIRNLTGLHLRPAGVLCNKAIQFKSKIHFQVRDTTANAKKRAERAGSLREMWR